MKRLALLCAVFAVQSCSCFDDAYKAFCASRDGGCETGTGGSDTGGGSENGGGASSGGGASNGGGAATGGGSGAIGGGAATGGGGGATGGGSATGGGGGPTGGGSGGGSSMPDGGPGPPVKVMTTVGANVSATVCSQVTLALVDANGMPTVATSEVTIGVSSDASALTFYGESSCTSSEMTNFRIAAGSKSVDYWFRTTSFGPTQLNASADQGLMAASVSFVSTAAAQLSINPTSDIVTMLGMCQATITLKTVDDMTFTQAVTPTQAISFALAISGAAKAASDMACSTGMVLMQPSDSSVAIYWTMTAGTGCGDTSIISLPPSTSLPAGLSPHIGQDKVTVYYQGHGIGAPCMTTSMCCGTPPDCSTSTCN